MADKVQKIRNEIERLQNELIQEREKGYGSDVDDACILELQNVLTYINSLQEDPVSEDLEEASKYYASNNTPWDDCVNEIQESFKAGVKWQKEKGESTTEDLGMYINELSKQFPEVSFAKLSRIAVRVAKWQKEQIMSKAIDFIIVDNNAVSTEISTFPYVSLGKEGDTVKLIIINQD